MKDQKLLIAVGALLILLLLWYVFMPTKPVVVTPVTPPTESPTTAASAHLPTIPTLPCQVVLVKNTCWKGYSVVVDYVDIRSSKHDQTISLGPDDTKTVVSFNCEIGYPHQFYAKFSPAIWVGDAQKTFLSKQVWQVPNSLPEGKAAYEMSLCFADDFEGVPVPTNNQLNCHCPA